MGRHAKPARLKSSAFVCLRMTPRFKADVCREAKRDDMEVSEWLRLLIAQELVARSDERTKAKT